MGAEELGKGPQRKEALLSFQGRRDSAFVGSRKPDRTAFSLETAVTVASWVVPVWGSGRAPPQPVLLL